MATLADLLRDPRFRSDISDNARDFVQSASNTAASNVTAPVDGLAWLLRRAGVPVPQAPVGGSNWANNAGLMAEPKNKNSLASLLGEAAGNIAPIAGYAKAPQIAGGLLKADEALQPVAGRMLDKYMEKIGGKLNAVHSPEQMAAWTADKKAKRLAEIASASALREAEKQLAQRSAERYGLEGMGRNFDASQLAAIKDYRLSGDRFGALAEGRAQTVNTLKTELEKLGYPIEKVSQQGGGNSIYANVNGQRVRISDHALPMTPERMTNRQNGLAGKWDKEVITDNWQGMGLKEYLAEILGKP